MLSDHQWRLVLHNIRLVIHIALEFPTIVLDLEDLVQEGILGLITAARKFDPTRGVRFSTYAWYWIRQGIFRAIANHQNLIRWPVYWTCTIFRLPVDKL
jgi:RNA polymerase nonessential primary-like sigma factor